MLKHQHLPKGLFNQSEIRFSSIRYLPIKNFSTNLVKLKSFVDKIDLEKAKSVQVNTIRLSDAVMLSKKHFIILNNRCQKN